MNQIKISIKNIILGFLFIISIIIVINYIKFLISPPSYEQKTNNAINLTELIKLNNVKSFNNIDFSIPYYVDTQGYLKIKVENLERQYMDVYAKVTYISQVNIPIITKRFLQKDKIIGEPEIRFDGNLVKLRLVNPEELLNDPPIYPITGDIYDCGINEQFYTLESFNLPGDKKTHTFEIKNLMLDRDNAELIDKVPLFFDKKKYYRGFLMPQILRILISSNSTSGKILYEVEIPPYKKIDKKNSGWWSIAKIESQYLNPKVYITSVKVSSESKNIVFYKKIEQYIDENQKGDGFIFETKASVNNFPFVFIILFVPDYRIMYLIIFILLFPYIYLLLYHRFYEKFKNTLFGIFIIYSSIITFIGFLSSGSYTEFLGLIREIYSNLNHLFLFFLILFPSIIVILITKLHKKLRVII